MEDTTLRKRPPRTTDLDTRRLLAHLVESAETGELEGALVIAFERGEYAMHLSGRAATDLVYAAGALSICEFALNRKIEADKPMRSVP